MTARIPRIVIVGAGFAGMFCARGLVGADAHITLIDKQNHHLFQPLLYQVATGFLGINDVALPIRSLFRGKDNVHVVMEEVNGIDTRQQVVRTEGHEYPYDYLVLGTGARYHFFGHDEWAPHVMVLKTLADAIFLRHQILTAFEKAEIEKDEQKRRALLTFVVIGGGPTGVEMAGAIADVVNHALEREFRHIRPRDIRILLLEAGQRMLGAMPEKLSHYADHILKDKGVEVHCGTAVRNIAAGRVETATETVESATILWAAGVRAAPVASWLGIEADRRGAIPVRGDLSIEALPNVYVAGDAATCMQDGQPLPALASVAKQQGKYLAYTLRRRVQGQSPGVPFHYTDLGTMATIGRNAAVADFKGITFRGWLAWMLWGVVHIYFLTGFRNRATVFLTWVWTYLTFGIGARIILKSGFAEKARGN
ncbi:NAD(P)-binding protein [bacterium]|nr:NAD(P)-binding protein [bacterium]